MTSSINQRVSGEIRTERKNKLKTWNFGKNRERSRCLGTTFLSLLRKDPVPERHGLEHRRRAKNNIFDFPHGQFDSLLIFACGSLDSH
jgi:hypothetical protein